MGCIELPKNNTPLKFIHYQNSHIYAREKVMLFVSHVLSRNLADLCMKKPLKSKIPVHYTSKGNYSTPLATQSICIPPTTTALIKTATISFLLDAEN